MDRKTSREVPTIRSQANTRSTFVILLGFFLLSFLVALALTSGAAVADQEDIQQAKNEAASLRQQVEQTNYELEVAIENLHGARYRLQQTEEALERNTALLASTEEDLAVITERLNTRVESIYRNGQMSLLEALFTATSFTELVNRLDLVQRVSESDAEMLGQVMGYKDKVQDTKDQLAQDQKDQAAYLAEAETYQAQVESALGEWQGLLAGKEAEVEQLIAEEEERQRRLAEERRAAEAAAAAAAAATASAQQQSSSGGGSSGGGGGGSSSGGSTPSDYQTPPSSGSGSSVVDVAYQYLGVPYVWGGESPSGFDCSGLVTYVFRQLGVSLPHYAAAQFGYGQPVSRGDLEPGDVVFFGSSLHHVGIYVGDGNMIHAPYTGAVVRVNSVDRSDYAGARRMI